VKETKMLFGKAKGVKKRTIRKGRTNKTKRGEKAEEYAANQLTKKLPRTASINCLLEHGPNMVSIRNNLPAWS